MGVEYSTILKLYKPQQAGSIIAVMQEYSTILKLYKPQLFPGPRARSSEYSTILKLYKPQRKGNDFPFRL